MTQMALPHPLPVEYARTVADRFRLLGDPTRLRLMDLLRDGERTVGSLADELGCTQANTSKQLALLADGGLVVAPARGAALLLLGRRMRACSRSATPSARRC